MIEKSKPGVSIGEKLIHRCCGNYCGFPLFIVEGNAECQMSVKIEVIPPQPELIKLLNSFTLQRGDPEVVYTSSIPIPLG